MLGSGVVGAHCQEQRLYDLTQVESSLILSAFGILLILRITEEQASGLKFGMLAAGEVELNVLAGVWYGGRYTGS